MFVCADFSLKFLKKQEVSWGILYNFRNRYQSQWSKGEKVETPVSKEAKDESQVPLRPKVDKETDSDSRISKYSSDEDDFSINKWKLELAWLTKALEPALQLYKRALPSGLFIIVLITSTMHFMLQVYGNDHIG